MKSCLKNFDVDLFEGLSGMEVDAFGGSVKNFFFNEQ